MSKHHASLKAVALIIPLALAGPATAQQNVSAGTLSCDVSAGVGLILTQRQSLSCLFTPANGAAPDRYTGVIAEYGVALGAVQAGHLVWGVLAPSVGVPRGALAGSYGGAGAQASVGVGVGANLLVGGTGRSFSLQPLSVQGMTGVNVAGGITSVTLEAAR